MRQAGGIFERYVTNFAPGETLELIVWGKMTFDDSVVLNRVAGAWLGGATCDRQVERAVARWSGSDKSTFKVGLTSSFKVCLKSSF